MSTAPKLVGGPMAQRPRGCSYWDAGQLGGVAGGGTRNRPPPPGTAGWEEAGQEGGRLSLHTS